ncbi:hypothetical protein RhiirA1_534960 [Rhizophagus irregularis]|uniref:Uncharacterized protein n=1 Tax=Rhizophagus irregularis TaxID=588596 RepID=A0A2N0RVP1_9GLOM|nr:hypothetical protein RhiirA1_534960 [Rhizophagus irregularis]
MSTNSNTSSTSNNNSSSQTQPSNSNDNVYRGVNDQGNKWTHRGDSVASGGSYHYSNQDNSYYYQNPDGSRYYNDGNGFSKFTSTKKETDVDYPGHWTLKERKGRDDMEDLLDNGYFESPFKIDQNYNLETDNFHNQYDQNEWPVESLSTHIPQISSVNEMYPYHNEELSQIALESPLPSPDLLTMTALPNNSLFQRTRMEGSDISRRFEVESSILRMLISAAISSIAIEKTLKLGYGKEYLNETEVLEIFANHSSQMN